MTHGRRKSVRARERTAAAFKLAVKNVLNGAVCRVTAREFKLAPETLRLRVVGAMQNGNKYVAPNDVGRPPRLTRKEQAAVADYITKRYDRGTPLNGRMIASKFGLVLKAKGDNKPCLLYTSPSPRD